MDPTSNTPPQPEAPLTEPPQVPTPPIDPLVPPTAPSEPPSAAPSVPPPTPSGSKKPLIIGVVVAILLLLVGVGMALSSKKPKSVASTEQTKSSSAASTAPTQAQQSATPEAPAAAAGYVTLEKLCYIILIPKDNDAGPENDCRFSARFGPQKLINMNVTNLTKYGDGLEANVAGLKASEAKQSSSLISEESVKIGGLDAKKLIFKSAGKYGLTTAHFLVATNKYKIDNVPVTGFEILAPSYDQPDNKTTIDTIIESWHWK